MTDQHRYARRQGLATLVVLATAGVALLTTSGSFSAGAQTNPASTTPDPVAPFAAAPVQVPLVQAAPTPTPTSSKPAAKPAKPPASAPIVTLPADLNVETATIPRRVLSADVRAAHLANETNTQCGLKWQTLAAIGFIESDNARSGGSANPHWDGIAFPPIDGPLLDGRSGTAQISDSDGGKLDGNPTWDRAVGPMQFLPSTWATWGADGDGDGVRNPQDIYDATLAAGNYLCVGGRNLTAPRQLIAAVYSYNHSNSYVKAVLTVAAHYEHIKPAALGVNLIHPKPAKKKAHRKTGPASHKATPRTTPAPGTSTLPSPPPTHSATPTPTPSPTPTWQPSGSPWIPPSSPTPSPTPTLSGPLVPGR